MDQGWKSHKLVQLKRASIRHTGGVVGVVGVVWLVWCGWYGVGGWCGWCGWGGWCGVVGVVGAVGVLGHSCVKGDNKWCHWATKGREVWNYQFIHFMYDAT
jgi:hypothetical protein